MAMVLLLATAIRMVGYAAVVAVTQVKDPDLCPCYGAIMTAEVIQAAAAVVLWVRAGRITGGAADTAPPAR